jgi:hypothetical protein
MGRDNDIHKGAIEDDKPQDEHNTSMRGQLGHRNQDPMIKGNDTDFPEPGENPEHSGEREEGTPERKPPAVSQKENQNSRKEDPLAG